MEDKTICNCYGVKKSEIVNAIENGATTVAEVGLVTKAGTGCGGCQGAIQNIIDEVVRNNTIIDDTVIDDTVIDDNTIIRDNTVVGDGEVFLGDEVILGEEVVTAEEMEDSDEDRLVCSCYKTTKGEIKDAVRADADTVAKVGNRTKAGTGCGRCRCEIQEIIDEVVSEQVICNCYNVEKGEIVNAIKNGATTVEEIGNVTKAGTGCGACKKTLQDIIDEVQNDELICNCYNVRKNEIVKAIEGGATTVEEVGIATKAGTGCGGCKGRIEAIIEEVNGNSTEEKGFFSSAADRLKGE